MFFVWCLIAWISITCYMNEFMEVVIFVMLWNLNLNLGFGYEPQLVVIVDADWYVLS